MRETLILEAPVIADDGTGGTIVGWEARGAVRAAVLGQAGSEGAAATGRTASRTVAFRIRYRDDVTPEWRLTWRGETWQVVGVVEAAGSRRRFHDLTASRITPSNPKRA